MTLILAGLVVSLYAINQVLVLFHHDELQRYPVEHRHADTNRLEHCPAPVAAVAGGVLLTLLPLRPLTLMGLDDGVARNLGLALSLARLAALTLAIVLSALLY